MEGDKDVHLQAKQSVTAIADIKLLTAWMVDGREWSMTAVSVPEIGRYRIPTLCLKDFRHVELLLVVICEFAIICRDSMVQTTRNMS